MPSASTPCVPDTADLIFHDQVCQWCSPPTNVSMKSKPRAFNCGRSLADCCVGGAACRCCGCCCCCCHCCCCCSSCCCIACMNWSSVNAISMLRVIQLCYHVRGLFAWSQRQSSLVMITVGRRCTKLTKRCEVCMWKWTVHNVSVGGRVVCQVDHASLLDSARAFNRHRHTQNLSDWRHKPSQPARVRHSALGLRCRERDELIFVTQRDSISMVCCVEENRMCLVRPHPVLKAGGSLDSS